MALNATPTDVTPSAGNSGITTIKAQTSSVVLVLEEGIDFDAIELDDTTRGEGDIVVMQACMEGDWKHLLHEVFPIYMQEDLLV